MDVDQKLPVSLADGRAAHGHPPIEGFVRGFFNLTSEEGKEVPAVMVDDFLFPFFGDTGWKLFSGSGA